MIDLALRRQFFSEDIQVCANLRTPALVDALAKVPREAYLRPGPWTFRSEIDMGAGPRQTPDADPKHVYHNVAIAIDAARQLFNGAPTLVASSIDALSLKPGHRVLHVGTGLGYFTAIIAHTVGPSGSVVGIEVDEALAAEAARNLAQYPWVAVQHGDATGPLDGTFDAILVNAGVTHPRDAWLDAVPEGGRIVLPLTAASPQMGPIGKGFMLALTKAPDRSFDVRMVTMVAIYSAIGLRDPEINAALGKALMRGLMLPPGLRLRREPHESDASCWLHAPTWCFRAG
jgi:protein-L-isoaspartate(D-aspartate) O-methyltransferase